MQPTMNTLCTESTPQTSSDFDIKPMQEKLKNILFAIDKVCNEHNLHYYLIAGTMLGAVRHKGFIPWDDDADIGMPRAGYPDHLYYAQEFSVYRRCADRCFPSGRHDIQ